MESLGIYDSSPIRSGLGLDVNAGRLIHEKLHYLQIINHDAARNFTG